MTMTSTMTMTMTMTHKIVSIVALLLASNVWAEWPEFRGPTSNGHAAGTTAYPTQWSETENVAWKTAIPFVGWSTPVVLGGEVWLTTATPDGRDYFLFGLDAATGDVFYQKRLFHSENPEPLGNNVNRYASPSPAIEGGRLYVHFGTYGTACVDTATREIVWERTDLECRHYRGPGSSVFLYDDLVILTFDGVDQQYLAALDKATGATRWRADRSTVWTDLDENGQPLRDGDARKAFSTPIVAETNGVQQLISLGSSNAFAYDPRTGRELWNVSNRGHTPSTRPVLYRDTVIVTTGYGETELRAIRLGGEGDVTDSHIAWRVTGNFVPDTPSPIVVDDLVYIVSDRGAMSCLDAATGDVVWSERPGGSYIASPIYAGGHLYFANVQGKTTIIKRGRAYEPIAENKLDDGMMASPAASDGALYLRTKTHLYRIDD